MQHGKEGGALDGKLKAPALEQGGQDLVDGTCLPEPLENRAGPILALRVVMESPRHGREDGEFL